MNTLEKFEKEHLKELESDNKLPIFNSGDTLKVHLKVKEGEKERIQIFEGVCIARKNAGINSSFTVRKISYGEGIERILPLFSPQINKIEVVKTGSVRRSKLYYLRKRSGKSARIAEKNILNQSSTNNDSQVDKSSVKLDSKETLSQNSDQTKQASNSTEAKKEQKVDDDKK